MKKLLLTVIGVFLIHVGFTQSRIFEHEGAFSMLLSFNYHELINDISDDPVGHDGYIKYNEDSMVYLDVEIMTRGSFRKKKENCDFPPLKLDLKKKQIKGTFFKGNDKFKLVTHCKDAETAYRDYLLTEYLIYKVYNILSEYSHRVQLFEITYQDNSGEIPDNTNFAFAIENIDKVAERLEGKELKVNNIQAAHTDPDVMNKLYLFQYMIGNTDWSVSALANIKLISALGPPKAVPNDFDKCGAINAVYAKPNKAFNLSSVRERQFMGHCQDAEVYADAIQQFNDKKSKIWNTINRFTYLSDQKKSDLLDYFEEFYQILNNEQEFSNLIQSSCQK